jgi:hypothetical protein
MSRIILSIFHIRIYTKFTVGSSRREGKDVKETDVGIAKADAPCFVLHAKKFYY